MQVKLLISRAGAGFSQNAGDVVEVEDAEAVRMIAAGQAHAIGGQKKETATKKTTAERAVKE